MNIQISEFIVQVFMGISYSALIVLCIYILVVSIYLCAFIFYRIIKCNSAKFSNNKNGPKYKWITSIDNRTSGICKKHNFYTCNQIHELPKNFLNKQR